MSKVNRYLIKNFIYIFLLANIIALLFRGHGLFIWLNAVAFGLCLLVFVLIRLTVRRYAAVFGNSPQEVADLLGRYIEDDRRGKKTFYDYLRVNSMHGQANR